MGSSSSTRTITVEQDAETGVVKVTTGQVGSVVFVQSSTTTACRVAPVRAPRRPTGRSRSLADWVFQTIS